MADLLAAREADGRLARHALPALAALCDELEHPPPPGLDRLAPLAEGFERLPEAPLPRDLTATLRPYQRQGVDWLAFLRGAGLGGVLADDMGLGKTLQALCAFAGPTLVVCPTSVLFNWQAELARFRPGLKVSLYHGAARALDPTADVTLTTYALLRLDAKALSARAWDAVVLDEAQAIKNPDSQVARAAYALPAPFRLALTGTPVENRLEELWSLLHFTNRGLLGGRSDFADRYARPIAEGRAGAAAALRQRVRPFVLRRLKHEVAPELPPRTEAVLRVELDDSERAVYDAVRAATRTEVVALLRRRRRRQDKGRGMLAALEALLRLRQAACHPALVPGQSAPHLVEARSAARGAVDRRRRGPQGAGVLAVDLAARSDRARPRPRRARVRAPRRQHARPRRRRGALPGPGRPAGDAGLAQGGRHRPQPDRRRPRVPVRPVVEPRRRGPGRRPRPPHRPDAPGDGLPAGRRDTVEERILALQESKRALVDAALGDGAAAAG